MINLVIVDDEKYIAEGLAYTIGLYKKVPLDIHLFTSALKAYDYCKYNPVQILLTDISMPGMTGLSLAAKVSKLKPRLQTIFLTGYSKFDYVYSAFQIENSQFVLKSESDETLLEAIDKAVNYIVESTYYKPNSEKIPHAEITSQEEGYHDTEQFSLSLVEKLEKYILDNINTDLSLNNLADILHFNPSYLSRFYKEIRGENISDYIRYIKIDKAKLLLIENKLNIQDISDYLGFGSASYFGTVFKQATGFTPSEYKRTHFQQKKNR